MSLPPPHPPTSTKEAKRLVRRGRLVAVTAWLISVASVTPVVTARGFGGLFGELWFRVLVCVGVSSVSLGIARVGQRRWIEGQRRLAPRAADVLGRDHRAPVLYLRSFADDGRLALPFEQAQVHRSISEEELLAEIFTAAGPVIALGRPGEELPELGAARLYVDPTSWQGTVGDLMRTARLTLLRVGTTPGVEWELRHAMSVLDPGRLVLLLPFGRAGYEQFRQSFASLPSLPPPTRLERDADKGRRRGGLRSVVYFEGQWSPRLLTIGHSWNQSEVSMIRKTLRPLVARHSAGESSCRFSARLVHRPGEAVRTSVLGRVGLDEARGLQRLRVPTRSRS